MSNAAIPEREYAGERQADAANVFVCSVVESRMLADSVFSVTVECCEVARAARPGQFIGIKCGDGTLLRRPVSICRVDRGLVELVFEVKGEGTRWLSEVRAGQSLDILGPLGNGFDVPRGKIIFVGGGIGAPPLLFAAEVARRSSAASCIAVLGFRDAGRVILEGEFRSVCDDVRVATDDGSYGICGTVAAPLEELLGEGGYHAVLACGPRVMLASVASICRRFETPCSVSLEERMGCCVGACLVCACATLSSGVEGMSRVCRDGPVFDACDVVW